MKVFYSDDYVAMAHSIDATKKPQWIAESLARKPIPNVELIKPVPASKDDLLLAHAPEYVTAVESGAPRQLAESSTFAWDSGTWTAELSSCGGMLAAAEAAMVEGVAGSLSCGFHHARRDRGRSHCVLNGLALTVLALRRKEIERILLIDLDAHCGGGTYSIVGNLPGYRQLDVSLFPTDKFTPVAPSTLDIVEAGEAYLEMVASRIRELSASTNSFEFCIYYAGMDPHEGSAFGGLPGIDSEVLLARDRLVFTWLRCNNVPCAFAIGGGYLGPGLGRKGLVTLHRNTINSAVEAWSSR